MKINPIVQVMSDPVHGFILIKKGETVATTLPQWVAYLYRSRYNDTLLKLIRMRIHEQVIQIQEDGHKLTDNEKAIFTAVVE